MSLLDDKCIYIEFTSLTVSSRYLVLELEVSINAGNINAYTNYWLDKVISVVLES